MYCVFLKNASIEHGCVFVCILVPFLLLVVDIVP